MNATAIIHVAKKELGLEDDDYRAILARVTGVSSVKDMDERQKQAVLTEMKRLGFRIRTTRGGRTVPVSVKPYIRLIHALWRSCHELGEVEHGTRDALRAFCKRFIAHDHAAVAVDPDLLSYDQAAPIIEALKAMEKRGKARADGAARAVAAEWPEDRR